MDPGALRQLFSEQRRDLHAVLEQWAESQEQSIFRALGAPSPAAPQQSPLAPSSSSGLLPSASGDTVFSDRHLNATASAAHANGNALDSLLGELTIPESGMPPGHSGELRAPESFVGVTPSGTRRALEAIQQNTHSNKEVVPPIATKKWWNSQAQCADDVAEKKVEAWCPKLDLLANVVNHVIFESVVTSLLLLNVAVIGLRVDLQAELVMTEEVEDWAYWPADTWALVENVFIFFYMAEILLRLLVFRVKFFAGKDWSWNCFDFFLVATSVPELVQASQNLSYLRLWRILKLVKILRVVRVASAFHELRVVLQSILGSVKALFWSMVLVTGTTYMVSIAFVQSTTDFVNQQGWKVAKGGEQLVDEDGDGQAFPAHAYFTTIPVGMRSLLASVTGGMDWLELSQSLWSVGPAYTFFFFCYIFFFHFVILNTMTSLFLDGVMQHQDKDQGSLVHDMLKKKVKLMDNLAEVHSLMCDDGSNMATLAMFQQHMTHPEMMVFARALEVDIVDLELVFDILSNHGGHAVDLESFVVGCIRLRGRAKSVDMISLSLAQRKYASDCDRQFADLRCRVAAVATEVYISDAVPKEPQSQLAAQEVVFAKPEEWTI